MSSTAGVESVDAGCYRRNLTLAGAAGSFEINPMPGKDALRLTLQLPDHSLLMPVVASIRRMFDLDANPAAIQQVLGQDRRLDRQASAHDCRDHIRACIYRPCPCGQLVPHRT